MGRFAWVLGPFFEIVGVICLSYFQSFSQTNIHRTYSKWFVEIFPVGANNSLATNPSSSPKGDLRGLPGFRSWNDVRQGFGQRGSAWIFVLSHVFIAVVYNLDCFFCPIDNGCWLFRSFFFKMLVSLLRLMFDRFRESKSLGMFKTVCWYMSTWCGYSSCTGSS